MFDDKVPEILQKEFPTSKRTAFKFNNGLINISKIVLLYLVD